MKVLRFLATIGWIWMLQVDRIHASPVLDCKIKFPKIESQLAIDSTGQSSLRIITMAKAPKPFFCPLMMVDMTRQTRPALPLYKFSFVRDKPCEPSLPEELELGLRRELNLMLRWNGQAKLSADAYVYEDHPAYDCHVETAKVPDLDSRYQAWRKTARDRSRPDPIEKKKTKTIILE